MPNNAITNIALQKNKSRIIFHIDFQSICTGFYSKQNLFYEINYYIQNRKPSNILIDEYRNYLNSLYSQFRQFSPFMVTFYDYGKNTQNTSISSGYKGGRSTISTILEDDEERALFYQIKERYFNIIEEKYSVENHGKVYFLKDFESDFIPYFCIMNNIHQSKNDDVLNVVLSNDKDLLQCCEFNNTIQCTNIFTLSKNNRKELKIELWDNYNAISYLYRNFKKGYLTAKHIPLILAIAGDRADGINGIKNIGYKKAIDLIQTFDIQPDYYYLKNNKDNLPEIIQKHQKLVMDNFLMISFKEQIKRSTKAISKFQNF
ncbi:MAG: hypothetical protein ACOC1O_02070 [bacterium]